MFATIAKIVDIVSSASKWIGGFRSKRRRGKKIDAVRSRDSYRNKYK